MGDECLEIIILGTSLQFQSLSLLLEVPIVAWWFNDHGIDVVAGVSPLQLYLETLARSEYMHSRYCTVSYHSGLTFVT